MECVTLILRASDSLLYLIGGILPTIALIIAGRRVHRRRNELRLKLDQIEQTAAANSPAASPNDADGQPLKRINYTYSSYADSYAEHAILRNAWDDFKGPGIATIIGLLCSAGASIWSLWI